MSKTQTYGRWPTFNEVIDYYSRPEVLSFLLNVAREMPVVFVIPQRLHWEPDWHDTVRVGSVEELRSSVIEQMERRVPKRERRERMDYYPSFHMALDRALGGGQHDYAFEADLEGWRRSFAEVLPALEVLDEAGIFCLLKFSGHRSLHLVIPGDVFLPPPDENAVSDAYLEVGRRLHRYLTRAADMIAAHPLPMARVPYSLNEDTGLVSVPLSRADLSDFRPWYASMYRVTVEPGLWEVPEAVKEAGRDFLHRVFTAGTRLPAAAPHQASERRLSTRPGSQANPVAPATEDALRALESPSRAVRLKTMLDLAEAAGEVSPEVLRKGARDECADVRWLALECLERCDLPERTCLLVTAAADSDDYVRAAAGDLLSPTCGPDTKRVMDVLLDPEFRPRPAFMKTMPDVAQLHVAGAPIAAALEEAREAAPYGRAHDILAWLAEFAKESTRRSLVNFLKRPQESIPDHQRAAVLLAFARPGSESFVNEIGDVLEGLGPIAARALGEEMAAARNWWALAPFFGLIKRFRAQLAPTLAELAARGPDWWGQGGD